MPIEQRPGIFFDVDATGKISETLRQHLRVATSDEARGPLNRRLADTLDAVVPKLKNSPRVRRELQRLKSDLNLYRDLDLTQSERELLEASEHIIDRNIERQQGTRRGGYGTWVDFGEVGRMLANIELLVQLGRADVHASPAAALADASQAAGSVVW